MPEPADHYTPRVRRALALAWDEARRDGAAAVAPEHLLRGLLRERDGVAAQALRRLGLTPAALRSDAPPAPAATAGPLGRWRAAVAGWWRDRRARAAPAAGPAAIPYTPAAAALLQQARAAAQLRDLRLIATEHLLLELVRDEAGPVAALLARHGVRPAGVHAAVRQVMDEAARGGLRI
jgi:ATP-dependent Clp protease ATP-binding subunit ClpC